MSRENIVEWLRSASEMLNEGAYISVRTVADGVHISVQAARMGILSAHKAGEINAEFIIKHDANGRPHKVLVVREVKK